MQGPIKPKLLEKKVETVTSKKDMRHRTRVDFSIKVAASREGEELKPFYSKDLSLRGLYIHTDQPFALGERCHLKIKLLERTDQGDIDVRGVVVRADDKGMGVQFTDIDPDSFRHLKNILYYTTGDPEKIDKEISSTPAFK